MKQINTRRANSFRSSTTESPRSESAMKSPTAVFWFALHAVCCLISLILGFRFSRLLFFLLFSTSPILHSTQPLPLIPPTLPNPNVSTSHVVVGRHGILIRPWPHPNPIETMKAHNIIERVQREQRMQYGIKSPRGVVVITPTYVRTFQTMHLTGLMHSLMLVPYEVTWIVVEAGGRTNETADLVARSKLRTVVHIGFEQGMGVKWADRHRIEARMRIQGLRYVRDQRLDGIVVFADDSNMHTMELFDEIQSLKWIGAVSVGILAQSGNSNSLVQNEKIEQEEEENLLMPVQGPACNSSGQLVGWHTFNSLPYLDRSATYVGDGATVLPTKMEWAGFVLNSRLVWTEVEGKPDWVKDLDEVETNEEEIMSPLVLLKDASFVEPLGNCGKKVMLWWLRVEARSDSKFPPGWIIDPPLEITVPAKRTPWPDAPPELPTEKMTTNEDHVEKRPPKTGRSSRSRHSSHGKRKQDSRGANVQISGVSQRLEK